MSAFKKNILVGLTVLVALTLLGWMILAFGDRLPMSFTQERMVVRFNGVRADGIGEGSAVLYCGVSVGRVQRTSLSGVKSVEIEAAIDIDKPLPANLVGIVKSQVIGGTSWVELEIASGEPRGRLEANATLPLEFRGIDLLPREFTELATEVRQLSAQFRHSQVIEHLDETILTAKTQFERIGVTIDSVQQFVGDDKMRDDVRQSIANFREATASAKAVSQNLEKLTATAQAQVQDVGEATKGLVVKADKRLDETTRQLGERLQQVAQILDNLDAATKKLNAKEGTAGKLLNDPRLYESLVDTSRDLNETVLSIKRIIEQWEQEGVAVNMK